jgi:antitoxin component YwqK of YwqJK toxin-antitoxin module
VNVLGQNNLNTQDAAIAAIFEFAKLTKQDGAYNTFGNDYTFKIIGNKVCLNSKDTIPYNGFLFLRRKNDVDQSDVGSAKKSVGVPMIGDINIGKSSKKLYEYLIKNEKGPHKPWLNSMGIKPWLDSFLLPLSSLGNIDSLSSRFFLNKVMYWAQQSGVAEFSSSSFFEDENYYETDYTISSSLIGSSYSRTYEGSQIHSFLIEFIDGAPSGKVMLLNVANLLVFEGNVNSQSFKLRNPLDQSILLTLNTEDSQQNIKAFDHGFCYAEINTTVVGSTEELTRAWCKDGEGLVKMEFETSKNGIKELSLYARGVIDKKIEFNALDRSAIFMMFNSELDYEHELLGALGQKTQYKLGQLNGLDIHYNDGLVKLIQTYRNDTLNGNYIEFHDNGQLYLTGFYSLGLKDKEWQSYDQADYPNDDWKDFNQNLIYDYDYSSQEINEIMNSFPIEKLINTVNKTELWDYGIKKKCTGDCD